MNTKKEHLKLSSEQLFNVYLECNAPGSPVKQILSRYNLKPWELAEIRKKVRYGALEALSSNGKRGKSASVVPLYQYQQIDKELKEAKDALAAVGHELSLLKKRTN
jgi:hypothetical protein